jgi:hypothetical protein
VKIVAVAWKCCLVPLPDCELKFGGEIGKKGNSSNAVLAEKRQKTPQEKK